ncbi:cyclic nucleotide-binding domain-containing protein 2-like [Ptychodera flava]|uniref:cyclic nucleotide-binding domain-containing protein 2-like n=1 Tax=Ptychodera flava TaxID=63121 RepID=UPI00396A39FC
MSVFDDSERTESTPSPTFARGRRGAVKIIISEGVGSAEEDISTNSKRQTSSEPPTQTKGALASEQDENLVKYSSEDKQGPGISSEENAEKEKNELRQRESANENVEQIKENSSLFRNKAKTPFARFRSVAKTVQHNLQWTKPPSKEEESKAFVVQHSEGGEPKTLTFNADAFKANIQSVQDLSEDVKRLLQVQSWNRTDKDVNRLFSIVKRLKCFDKYPSVVKKELSRVLYYETFEEGRVVVQQGQPGMSFYFILSGTVSVEVKEADKVTGESHRQVIGELGPGASFGELALLHNSKRTATIVCKGNCEFLRVDKPDFDMVLRLSHEQGWEKRLAAIKSLDIFKNWSEAEQKAACDRAKLHEYSSNTEKTSGKRTSSPSTKWSAYS